MPMVDVGTLERVTRDIFSGMLSGTGAAQPNPGPVRNGTLMMCLDPKRFLPLADFHAQVATLFGFPRRANGVPLDDETWRQITECAAEVGVSA